MSSHPDIFFGATLKMNVDPFHYCVFISQPTPPDNQILMVRLTGLSEKWEDHCVLSATDYPLLTKLTVPAYRGAVAGPAAVFQAQVANGNMAIVDSIPEDCLNKILEGAHDSEEMASKFKVLLPPKAEPPAESN